MFKELDFGIFLQRQLLQPFRYQRTLEIYDQPNLISGCMIAVDC
jgi:hypothetical protein